VFGRRRPKSKNVTTIESVDVSCHHSKDTWIEVGYGLPVDDSRDPGQAGEVHPACSPTAVLMMADCFDLPPGRRLKFSYELGACTKGTVDLGLGTRLPKGSLGWQLHQISRTRERRPAASRRIWSGRWTPHTDPSWHIKGCYITQINRRTRVFTTST